MVLNTWALVRQGYFPVEQAQLIREIVYTDGLYIKAYVVPASDDAYTFMLIFRWATHFSANVATAVLTAFYPNIPFPNMLFDHGDVPSLVNFVLNAFETMTNAGEIVGAFPAMVITGNSYVPNWDRVLEYERMTNVVDFIESLAMSDDDTEEYDDDEL